MGKRRSSAPIPQEDDAELPILHAEPPLRLETGTRRLVFPELAMPRGRARAVLKMEGPIPHPEILREYEGMVPGLASRIVGWAENEAAHRRAMERSLIRLSWAGVWCALAVTLVTVTGGMALAWRGRSTAGLIGVIGAVAALTIVFVAGRGRLPADTSAPTRERPATSEAPG